MPNGWRALTDQLTREQVTQLSTWEPHPDFTAARHQSGLRAVAEGYVEDNVRDSTPRRKSWSLWWHGSGR
jgi:hypothetical protein